MVIFSIVIGTIVITPGVTGGLLAATHYAFITFGFLCAAGVWFSAVRGNLRDAPRGQSR
jgi:hypothetical protein